MDTIIFYLDNFNNLHIYERGSKFIKVLYYNSWYTEEFFNNIEHYIINLYDEIYNKRFKEKNLIKCNIMELQYNFFLNN